VDRLLEAMEKARSIEELRDASRALDRVIMHGYYQIPALYSGTFRVSRWDRFGLPATQPKFFTIESGLEVWPVWPLMAWWSRDAAGH
jgi:ABC-type oligopeptide transport system substrate-binding subunit